MELDKIFEKYTPAIDAEKDKLNKISDDYRKAQGFLENALIQLSIGFKVPDSDYELCWHPEDKRIWIYGPSLSRKILESPSKDRAAVYPYLGEFVELVLQTAYKNKEHS